MSDTRADLLELLESQYRGFGWEVERAEDGTLRAAGPGGVTWIGAVVVAEDLTSGDLEARLPALSRERMPKGGELCPLDLMPDPECEADLRALLDRLDIRRPHVSLYSLRAT
ncbi:MAG: hypothetical protein WD844_00510 [Thermoleophilaceae bacterium]